MTAEEPGAVTLLLRALKSGDDSMRTELMDLIYPELRILAERQFRHERRGHVLQPTALVHEAYLRLVHHADHNWENRAHFFGAAARVMRRVLVDYARARRARKRNHGCSAVSVQDIEPTQASVGVDLIALDEALDALEQLSPRQARIVQLRYFAGLSVGEVAEVLGVTSRTVDRDWAAARAWLRVRLGP